MSIDCRRLQPFTEGIPLNYRASFDASQFSLLMKGLDSHGMDDKWLIHYSEPHLFFHRSWTGRPVYRLTLEPTPNGAHVIEALWARDSQKFNWGTDYESVLLDFLLSNLLLGQAKPFPVPPGLTEFTPGALQHNISGTGYPAVAVRSSARATELKKP